MSHTCTHINRGFGAEGSHDFSLFIQKVDLWRPIGVYPCQESCPPLRILQLKAHSFVASTPEQAPVHDGTRMLSTQGFDRRSAFGAGWHRLDALPLRCKLRRDRINLIVVIYGEEDIR